MLVNTIIDDLRFGELSAHGMFMTDDLSGKDRSRLVHHMNVALTELYTRFPLLTRELTLVQIEGRTLYPLRLEHRVEMGNMVDYDHYIMDSDNFPFTGDLVRVLGAYTEDGTELQINDSTAQCVITTPAVDVVELPIVVPMEALFLIYQAKHEEVNLDTVEIHLPVNFKPALLAYIAYRVYSGGTAQDHSAIAQMMLQKYELFCTQQMQYATDNSVDFEKNTKPCLRGWV